MSNNAMRNPMAAGQFRKLEKKGNAKPQLLAPKNRCSHVATKVKQMTHLATLVETLVKQHWMSQGLGWDTIKKDQARM